MESGFRNTISKEEMEKLPQYVYEGEIMVINRVEEARIAVAEITQAKVVGFDTETKPSFQKGVINKVSLIQLATPEKVYLFRIHHCGFIPQLRKIFSDKNIIKVGVGIRDDIKALRRIAQFNPASFLDLQNYAPTVGIEDKSFSKLMAIIFGVRISKRQRVTNWEAPDLTEAQLRYAATDAWGARRMFMAIYKQHEALIDRKS
ncbi:MAG: 3'-5' exonuclease [Marinifilaceae bacterium]